MPEKKAENPVFEIFVVLAIVAIVAVTGQVLLHFENKDTLSLGGDGMTGFAVADYEEEPAQGFLDVGIDNIEVNPPSPLIGEPFELKITVANTGFVEINTPFYIEAELTPMGNTEPIVLNSVITQVLKPGEKASAVFNIITVTNEGPLKILATADSTAKLDDQNPSNDRRSKTVIITAE